MGATKDPPIHRLHRSWNWILPLPEGVTVIFTLVTGGAPMYALLTIGVFAASAAAAFCIFC